MKYTDDHHFHEILFQVKNSMKQMVDPIKGHKQAIEYREINMNKKLYFVAEDQMDKMKEMERENKKFIRKFKDMKIQEFQIFNQFHLIFGKKIYFNEMKRWINVDKDEELDLKYLFKFFDTILFMMNLDKISKHFKELVICNNLIESIHEKALSKFSFS